LLVVISFGPFWLKKHSELTQKLLFCCHSSFPPLTGRKRRAFGCWQHQKGNFQKVHFECIFDVIFVTSIA